MKSLRDYININNEPVNEMIVTGFNQDMKNAFNSLISWYKKTEIFQNMDVKSLKKVFDTFYGKVSENGGGYPDKLK